MQLTTAIVAPSSTFSRWKSHLQAATSTSVIVFRWRLTVASRMWILSCAVCAICVLRLRMADVSRWKSLVLVCCYRALASGHALDTVHDAVTRVALTRRRISCRMIKGAGTQAVRIWLQSRLAEIGHQFAPRHPSCMQAPGRELVLYFCAGPLR